MKITISNQIIRLVPIVLIVLGSIFGAKGSIIAMITSIILLLICIAIDGVRVCRQSLKNGKRTDTFLAAISYIGGIIILLVGLHSLLNHSDKITSSRESSQLIGSALVVLLSVFFVAFIKEGVFSLNKNIHKKRYAAFILNVVVLVGGLVAIITGYWWVTKVFFLF